MWIEELEIENIRCFEHTRLRFVKEGRPCPWVTLLGENGTGKSTALQALALTLAGEGGGWLSSLVDHVWRRDDTRDAIILAKVHQGRNDPGDFSESASQGALPIRLLHVAGTQVLAPRVKWGELILGKDQLGPTWHDAAFAEEGRGWFAAGYGPFRRLTRSSRTGVPGTLPAKARRQNFVTLFNEDEPLAALEQWMVHLDYRIAKTHDAQAKRQMETGIEAINRVLPKGISFSELTTEGRVLFDVQGQKVPSIALSDGYRSVLALMGDLIWRLMQSFPGSEDPLSEEGVVLIDELDIHLHPVWQRHIAGLLRDSFKNIQFIVATHSPLIAAGAGRETITWRFSLENGKTLVQEVEDIAAMNVDRILQSDAFSLVSPYSPQTQRQIDRYDELARLKDKRSPEEEREFEEVSRFMRTARPVGGKPEPGSLQARIEDYLSRSLP